jgi:hypothetical protein
MCAEASTVLRVVAADFFFNCWYLEIPSDNRIRHLPRCVNYHAQGFHWKRSRISMLEVEAVPRVGAPVTAACYPLNEEAIKECRTFAFTSLFCVRKELTDSDNGCCHRYVCLC